MYMQKKKMSIMYYTKKKKLIKLIIAKEVYIYVLISIDSYK